MAAYETTIPTGEGRLIEHRFSAVDLTTLMENTRRDSEWRGFEERVKQIMKDHMHDLYQSLRDELEYLSSDEAVWETIEANGLDEDEDDEDD